MIISNKEFENQLFVQCECGEEIIEFCRDSKLSEDGSVEYFIRYHGYFNPKVDSNPWFTFCSKNEFSYFLSELKRFIDGNSNSGNVSVLRDKYLTYKNKLSGILIFMPDKDGDFFLITKYPKKFKRIAGTDKCSWGIVINKETAEKVLEELSEWK